MANHTREVQLWLDNVESDYREAVSLAEEALQVACDNESHAGTARSDAVDKLAEDLSMVIAAGMPSLPGMWGSLVSSLMDDIDFEELAKHYLDDLPIWAIFSSDAEEAELFTDLDLARECLMEKVDSGNATLAGVPRFIEGMDDGDKVNIEGTTYYLVKS